MWSLNGKVWSPEIKNVQSKIPTHLSLEWPAHIISHAETAE